MVNLLLKIEKSRRVGKSRPVCEGLKLTLLESAAPQAKQVHNWEKIRYKVCYETLRCNEVASFGRSSYGLHAFINMCTGGRKVFENMSLLMIERNPGILYLEVTVGAA